MNEYDSNRISDLFKANGYLESHDSQNVNCYILNTCHIREKATEKVYSDIGRLKKNYRNKTKPFVFITGCVAQAENKEMIRREPYIDAVIGPQSYQNIPNILSSLNNNYLISYLFSKKGYFFNLSSRYESNSRFIDCGIFG